MLFIAPALRTLISAAPAALVDTASSPAIIASRLITRRSSLKDVVEAHLERLAVLLDLLVVHGHQLDLRQRRIAGRRLDVRARGVDTLARKQSLHGIADHELGEGLGRVRMRRALDDRGRRRDGK